MSSSRSWSIRLAALALALAAPACAGRRAGARGAGGLAPGARIAVLPVENLSGAIIPLEEIGASVRRALEKAGIRPVGGEPVERFLAAHRLRNTGGVDRAAAAAAREELGADALVVTSVELYATEGIPRLALVMRLVSVAGEPTIAWIDGAARAGDDSPGLFGLGVTRSMEKLEREVLARLARSLSRFLAGKGPAAPPCPRGDRWAPKVAFREAGLTPAGPVSVAVLPFVPETMRRGAGEILALEFVRHLVGTGAFRVLEPGVVRGEVVRFRIVQESGVTLEQARLMTDVLDVDAVLAGTVRELQDFPGSPQPPLVDFTAQLIERAERRVVWESTSRNRGDDAVSLFGRGAVSTASELACRMVRRAVEGIVGGERHARRGPAQHDRREPDPAQWLRQTPSESIGTP